MAAGDLWVISHHRSMVTRLDRASRVRHGDQPVVGRGASDIAARENLIWVAVPRRGEVVLVDARSGHVEARVEPPAEPVRVALGRSGLWVAGHGASDDDPDVLLHYDRAGAQLLHRVAFRDRISAITLGDGAVWVAFEMSSGSRGSRSPQSGSGSRRSPALLPRLRMGAVTCGRLCRRMRRSHASIATPAGL